MSLVWVNIRKNEFAQVKRHLLYDSVAPLEAKMYVSTTTNFAINPSRKYAVGKQIRNKSNNNKRFPY